MKKQHKILLEAIANLKELGYHRNSDAVKALRREAIRVANVIRVRELVGDSTEEPSVAKVPGQAGFSGT